MRSHSEVPPNRAGIEFRVFRFDPQVPPDDSAINGEAPEYLNIGPADGNAIKTQRASAQKGTRFDAFQVPEEKGMTVLDGLYYILENLDDSLAFRSSCRAAVCGSCAMHINGKYRLACNTLVSKLASPVVIRPLAHLTVIKDLVVDMTNFFRHYEAIKPYLMRNAATSDKEVSHSPEE
ncbi:MAG: 2Fe-2S iron-sulfur cluster binding domain-containing protein, partial [Planctomycetes bacterium]|nr:2Fe-2S iron-sulfur cluster binding domain-containing protein [Planctomycetota bacterium]